MKYSAFIFSTLFFVLATYYGNAQGCSDAGFCTAGSLGGYHDGDENAKEYRNRVSFVPAYEIGEKRIPLFIPQVKGNFGIDESNSVEITVPYVVASGDLGTNQGIGDIIATLTHRFLKKNDWEIYATAGTRIASGNANDEIDGKDLPMPYQTSLGTYDLILGGQFKYKTWLLSMGTQVPLVQANDNEYNPLEWPEEDAYFESRELERKADVMLRVEKVFTYKRGYIKAGLLPIYHIQNDTYLKQNLLGEFERVEADNSQGLTLNAILTAEYSIADQWVLTLAGGAPMIVRENRPDGLTRSLVIRPGISFRF